VAGWDGLCWGFFLTVGIGWILASLTVFVRDVRQLLGLALTLWMFLTPVVYPPAMVPAAFQWILDVNPMYYVVQGYRDLVLELPLQSGTYSVTVALSHGPSQPAYFDWVDNAVVFEMLRPSGKHVHGKVGLPVEVSVHG